MTREEFKRWLHAYGKVFGVPEEFDEKLDSVIAQATAEHEASQWKKYPENKPNINETYWVHTKNGSEYHMNSSEFEKYYVIAFREPHRYTSYRQEGGEG